LTEVVRLREAYGEDAARTPLTYREGKKPKKRSGRYELTRTSQRGLFLGRAELPDVVDETRRAAKQMTNDFGIELPRVERLPFEDTVGRTAASTGIREVGGEMPGQKS